MDSVLPFVVWHFGSGGTHLPASEAFTNIFHHMPVHNALSELGCLPESVLNMGAKGKNGTPQITVFRRAADLPEPKYLALVRMGPDRQAIFCDDWLTMMELLNKMAPIIEIARAADS